MATQIFRDLLWDLIPLIGWEELDLLSGNFILKLDDNDYFSQCPAFSKGVGKTVGFGNESSLAIAASKTPPAKHLCFVVLALKIG